MKAPSGKPMTSERPNYTHLHLIHRKINPTHWYTFIGNLISQTIFLKNETIYHTGILDIQNNVVLHYYTRGEDDLTAVSFTVTTIKEFMENSQNELFYEIHELSDEQQLCALFQAYCLILFNKLYPYNPFYHNCQQIPYSVCYPERYILGQAEPVLRNLLDFFKEFASETIPIVFTSALCLIKRMYK